MTELNTVGIVYVVGVEKDKHSKDIVCTVQVLRPGTFKKDSASKEPPIEIASSKGKTLADAVDNMSNQFDRKIIFSQNKALIIDEKLARKGILPILDYFKRDYAVRNLQWVIIAKNSNVKELIGIKHGLSNIQGAYLENIVNEGQFNSISIATNLLNFYKEISSEGICPVTGVIQTIKQPIMPKGETTTKSTKGILLSGIAAFRGDKLIGYLDNYEAKGFNWITGDFSSGIINIPGINNPKKLISIRISNVKSSIEPKIVKNKVIFDIKISSMGNICQIEDGSDTSTDEAIKRLQNETKKVIKKEVKTGLGKMQKGLKCDIVGFGSALSKKYPDQWEKVKKDWAKKFPKAKYYITANVAIKGQGAMFKPIKVQSK